jgi:hypothetical protein
MQTFLPYPDFQESARVLDRQRLGKQRVECLQILRTLTASTPTGWHRHPAVLMWRGHTNALVRYGTAICTEWLQRGYQDSCLGKIYDFTHLAAANAPSWLGSPALHASHRSNLLRKDAT